MSQLDKFIQIGTLIITAIATSACTDDVVGSWEAKERIGTDRSEMTVTDDGTGEATIYFYYGEQRYFADFDIEWEADSDDYRLDMECDGDCSALDFEMRCELTDDATTLDCNGSDAFDDYEFEWDKSE